MHRGDYSPVRNRKGETQSFSVNQNFQEMRQHLPPILRPWGYFPRLEWQLNFLGLPKSLQLMPE